VVDIFKRTRVVRVTEPKAKAKPERPRQLRRPKLLGRTPAQRGLVEVDGVVCRPECPQWWQPEESERC
jgi:hypothetical protein